MNGNLLLIKGAVSDLSADEQKAVANAREAIKQLIESHGDAGLIALTWLALELAQD